jgi:hypothetical protein
MNNQTKCFSNRAKIIIAVFLAELYRRIEKMGIDTLLLDFYVVQSDQPTSLWLQPRQKITLCSHAPAEGIYVKIQITSKLLRVDSQTL